MRIDATVKYELESYQFSKDMDIGTELTKAIDLLYALLQGSFHAAGTALSCEINGNQETVQSLYWKCREMLEKAGTNFEKTEFLAMSILEQTYRNAKPLLLCRMGELMSGECTMVEQAKKLEALFADNPYKKLWNEKAQTYIKILQQIGFNANLNDFSDLTAIMDPLLDAFSFYGDKKINNMVNKVRNGAPSHIKKPEISRSICKYHSEKELVDAVMESGRDCAILFGAVEKTNRQIIDHFKEWYNGYPEERQRNFMRNAHMTAEEYLNAPCDHYRRIYLCVKSGESCWLVHMPWKGSEYSNPGEAAHAYHYGHRASYAPFEIFIKDDAPAPEGTTLLTVPKNGCLLSELMDSLSMAWFPAFMDETIKYFFRTETEPESKDWLLCEEAAALLPKQYHTENKPSDKYDIIPTDSKALTKASYVCTIKEPTDLELDSWFKELLHELKITAKDMIGVPLLPVTNGTVKDFDRIMDNNTKRAYIKLAALKIAEILEDKWQVRRWVTAKIQENKNRIIELASQGSMDEFMTVTIDKLPIYDADGKPIIETMNRYPYTKQQKTEHTSPDDARERTDITSTFARQVLWASIPTTGKPPVVWYLSPKKPEHYAMLTGTDIKDLPYILQLSELFTNFRDTYKNMLHGDIMNEWLAKGYGDGKPSAYMPCMAPVNICMTKKMHYSFSHFRDTKPKSQKKEQKE